MPLSICHGLLGFWGAFKSLAFRPLWRHTATSSRRFYDGIIPSRRFDICWPDVCRQTSYYKKPYGSRGRARRALTKRVQFQFQMDCFLTLFSPWHLLSFQAKAVLLVVAWKKKTKVLPHLYQMKMRILKVGKNWKFWFVRINWCVLT